MVVFVTVGVASTLAYSALYAVLARPLGGQGANVAALLVTAVANTAANRRFTFGVTGRRSVVRHQAQGLLVFGLALALTSGSLAALHLAQPRPPRLVEVAALTAANLAATVLRYCLLRWWVFSRTA